MVSFDLDPEGPRLTCRFSPRMDAATSAATEPAVTARLDRELAAPGGEALQVVFDLSGVEFVASAFLRICMAAARRSGPGRFEVAATSPQLKKLFTVAGLDGVFPVG
jgi:anti-anti-sigma factor